MWKKFFMLSLSLLFASTLLMGCGGGTPAPAKPSEPPTAKFKLGTGEAKLFEMKGDFKMPELQSSRASGAAVTADAIYVFAEPESQGNNQLKMIRYKGNKLESIADVGMSRDPYVYANQKYAWFRTGEGNAQMLNVYDGKKLTTKKYNKNYMTPYGSMLSKEVYVSYNTNIIEGTIDGTGEFKEGKMLLKNWSKISKARGEVSEALSGADSDAFYLRSRLKGIRMSEDSSRLYAYGRDGKEIRGFDINAAKNKGVPVYPHKSSECVVVTEHYVVFTIYDLIRVFDKKNGNYVGEFDLKLDEKNELSVSVAIAMGKDDIMLLCKEQPAKLYRLVL